MAHLVGMSENVKGQKFELNKDRTTIGRAATSDIVVVDAAISSQHCYISRRGDRYVLHDMNSTNGTSLNAARVTEAELKPKQVIQLGSTELMFDGVPVTTTSSMTPVVNTEVIVDDAPSIAPKSFSSVSPFGTRRKENNKGVWLAVIAVVGIAALAGLVFFIYKILM